MSRQRTVAKLSGFALGALLTGQLPGANVLAVSGIQLCSPVKKSFRSLLVAPVMESQQTQKVVGLRTLGSQGDRALEALLRLVHLLLYEVQLSQGFQSGKEVRLARQQGFERAAPFCTAALIE